MKFTVYILFSVSANKHYTGYTSDLQQPILSHNQLGNHWTRSYRPWKLVFSKDFESKSDAIKFEKWLKTGVGREFIKKLEH